jgi:hypothetical protein
MPEVDLTGRQLDLIAHLGALQPPMFLMGGYAEDALLAGRVTRCAWTSSPSSASRSGTPGALRLSDDMFDQPPVELEGTTIRTISPLALYQIRAGVAQRNSFGPLSDRQLAAMAELRERFFPDPSEEQLLPPSEPLPG